MCSECEEGYGLAHNICYACQAGESCFYDVCTIPNCMTCTFDSEGGEICVECWTDNFEIPDSLTECVPTVDECPVNVAKCASCSEGVCDDCYAPWVLSVEGDLVECVEPECSTIIDGCSSCAIVDTDSGDQFVCRACEGDKALIAN